MPLIAGNGAQIPRPIKMIQSHFCTIAGQRLHYLRAGERGTVLLLLHGTALDSASLTYGQHIAYLAQKHRVYALDWLGYGESDKPAIAYSTALYAQHLRAFIADVLPQEALHIVAFSMGGAIALDYALDALPTHPLRRLVLLSSYGLGHEIHVPFLPYLGLQVPHFADFIWRKLGQSRQFLAFCMKLLVFADGKKVDAELVALVQEQLEQAGLKQAFLSWLEHEIHATHLTTSHLEQLPQLHIPTLFLHGANDVVIPALRSRRAVKRVARGKLVIVPRCGHWVAREAPAVLRQQLENFL